MVGHVWTNCANHSINARKFILMLKIEPFLFLTVLSISLSNITTSQLIQDKLCLIRYNQTWDYCSNISTSSSSSSTGATTGAAGLYLSSSSMTNKILGDLAQFGTYQKLIGTLPALITVLFIADPLGIYLAGRLMANQTILRLTEAKQLHDYNTVYIICLASIGLAFIWLLLAINETNITSIGPPATADDNENANILSNSLNDNERQPLMTASTSRPSNASLGQQNDRQLLAAAAENQPSIVDSSPRFSIDKLFDIENVRQMFATAFKRRPNNGRQHLWLLYLSMFIINLSSIDLLDPVFPFAEKVYHWDIKQFTIAKSLVTVLVAVTMAPIGWLLSTKLTIQDTKLGILGYVSELASALAIGTIPNCLGFYLMYLLGGASSFRPTATRSLISKLIKPTESGQIFSVSTLFETLAPAVQSLVFNTVFQLTIGWYPSLVFHLAGSLVFVPLAIIIWIDNSQVI
ncbi:uncharacterized protein LOC128956474 [Oppia nitens]|uniref:uncharacterized protein LOC128956474 n=1 Tax=Oppia nitens TaxID=1686743 RepID=UPI0023DBA5E9|nr:uncharacterized protein LOC128956474 [Oppia nitens]